MTLKIVTMKKETNSTDLVIWIFLHDLIVNLGEDGMSSDESDVDELGNQIFVAKDLPWRREMSSEMQMIDSEHRRLKRLKTNKGTPLTRRLRRVNTKESRRSAPTGLVRKLYKKAWVAALPKDDLQELKISGVEFRWLNIFPA